MKSYKPYVGVLKSFQKRNKLKTMEQALELLHLMSERFAKEETDQKKVYARNLYGVQATCDLDIFQGKGLHLFLPDRKFCDWLVDCVDEKHATKRHIELAMNLSRDNILVVHPHTDSGLEPLMVNFLASDNGGIRFCVFSSSVHNGGGIDGEWALGVRVSEDCDITTLKGQWLYYGKLLFGLGMYVDCFPEVLINGWPADFNERQEDHLHASKAGSQVVTISPKVVESFSGTHASPMPHYRKGFFRPYTHPRFVNVRGQTRFVKATMVRGKAETVLAPDEVPAKDATGSHEIGL